MAEETDMRGLYLLRARELRDLAAKLKHPEYESSLIAMALQYERLAAQPAPLVVPIPDNSNDPGGDCPADG